MKKIIKVLKLMILVSGILFPKEIQAEMCSITTQHIWVKKDKMHSI